MELILQESAKLGLNAFPLKYFGFVQHQAHHLTDKKRSCNHNRKNIQKVIYPENKVISMLSIAKP